MATTYSPGYPVPSALLSLTSLFGMGRGEPQCYNHHKIFAFIAIFYDIIKKENTRTRVTVKSVSRKLTGN